MGVMLGLNAKLFRGAAGQTAATEMKNVKDLTLNIETAEADVTTRASKGWRQTAPTLKDATLEFGMVSDESDVDFKAIRTAFLTNAPVAFFVSNGNGSGLDADFTILSFNEEQNLEGAQNVSVSAKPAYSTRAPVYTEAGENPA